jgi:hypothetical protein
VQVLGEQTILINADTTIPSTNQPQKVATAWTLPNKPPITAPELPPKRPPATISTKAPVQAIVNQLKNTRATKRIS